jgi:pyruvate dehydrogenase E2 component (dihydrolipoamide acetyltransferase)
MATNVHMEALSPTMEEGQLVRWLKKEGDAISEGDVLAEIETDKATMELVARGSGVLQGIRLQEGETAPVGQVIAVIAGEGEAVETPAAEKKETKQAAPAAQAADAAVAEEEEAERREAAPAAAAGKQAAAAEGSRGRAAPAEIEDEDRTAEAKRPDGRVKASPLARRMASEAGVELGAVSGSGPGGRITKADIEAALQSGARPAAAAAPAPAGGAAQPAEPGAATTDVPVTQMRKTIAKRLVTSIGPVPTFYLTVDVDMARTLELRERLNQRLEKGSGGKASINDFIIKAVAMALVRHPDVNASWGDTVIHHHGRVHVGVAVAIEDGLITPVIRDADRKGVAQIAAEVRELAGRAREKKLMPDEYTGATFSVSNLGMFGIHEFTAIINPPESGILAVGAVEDAVVAVEGQPAVRPRMRMTMSCDHRVVDGATGARFLQTLRDYLEEPMMMLA